MLMRFASHSDGEATEAEAERSSLCQLTAVLGFEVGTQPPEPTNEFERLWFDGLRLSQDPVSLGDAVCVDAIFALRATPALVKELLAAARTACALEGYEDPFDDLIRTLVGFLESNRPSGAAAQDVLLLLADLEERDRNRATTILLGIQLAPSMRPDRETVTSQSRTHLLWVHVEFAAPTFGGRRRCRSNLDTSSHKSSPHSLRRAAHLVRNRGQRARPVLPCQSLSERQSSTPARSYDDSRPTRGTHLAGAIVRLGHARLPLTPKVFPDHTVVPDKTPRSRVCTRPGTIQLVGREGSRSHRSDRMTWLADAWARRRARPRAAHRDRLPEASTHVLRCDQTAARDALAEMASAGHRIPRWLDDVGRHGWFTAPVTLDLADFTQRPSPDQLPHLAAVIDSAVAATTDLANAAHQLQFAFEAGTSWTSGWVTCIPRLLGVAAVHLGQFDDAERWLATATVACDVADARTERAAVEAGRTLLSAAGGTVDDLVLHTALATANGSHLAGLATIITRRASTARAAAADRQSGRVNDARHRVPPTRAMLFTDIVDSTGVNVRVGDRTFVAMLDRHNHVLRSAVEAHRGVIFHNTGDGYGAWFTHAADGAACALAMHNALAAEPGFTERLQIRVGIACGAPIAVDGDLFGIDVVRAARLCTAAQPNGTCVDAATATAVRGMYDLRPIEPVRLKGFPDPEQLFLLLD